MKGFVLLAGAVSAAIALSVSAAGAAPGSATPLARSALVGAHRIPLSAAGADAKPRGLDGVPASGSYGFLLKLATEPTGRAYDTTLLSHGLRAARTAATDQLATVRAAESNVIAALPTDSQVLYRMHAVLAGVAVYTKVSNLAALQRISGVSA